MESIDCDTSKSWQLTRLDRKKGRHLAPLDQVADWEFEVDAVRYCVNHVLRSRRGLTQMQLADDMRWSRANLTKVLQEQSAMPKESSVNFMQHTNCMALQQFRNLAHGLITKTIVQEREDQELLQALLAKNAELETEIAELERKFRRIAGES